MIEEEEDEKKETISKLLMVIIFILLHADEQNCCQNVDDDDHFQSEKERKKIYFRFLCVYLNFKENFKIKFSETQIIVVEFVFFSLVSLFAKFSFLFSFFLLLIYHIIY